MRYGSTGVLGFWDSGSARIHCMGAIDIVEALVVLSTTWD
jgi:hypothetical protein